MEPDQSLQLVNWMTQAMPQSSTNYHYVTKITLTHGLRKQQNEIHITKNWREKARRSKCNRNTAIDCDRGHYVWRGEAGVFEMWVTIPPVFSLI